MQRRKNTTTVRKMIVDLAKKIAIVEANTACVYINYQPMEPKTLKHLRKF